MKKKTLIFALALVGVMAVGCNGGKSTDETTTEQTTESTIETTLVADDTNNEALKQRFENIREEAFKLNANGTLSDEDYEVLIGYGESIDTLAGLEETQAKQELERISTGLDEFDTKIKAITGNYNVELKNRLQKLIESAKELNSIVDTKIAEGSADEVKRAEVNSNIEKIQKYLDQLEGEVSTEQIESIEDEIGVIQGSLVAIAGQVSDDNSLIDRIMGIE